jgi:hypothetical protein
MAFDIEKPTERKSYRFKLPVALMEELEEKYLPYKQELEGDPEGEWVNVDSFVESVLKYMLERSQMTTEYRKEMRRRAKQASKTTKLKKKRDSGEVEEGEGEEAEEAA